IGVLTSAVAVALKSNVQIKNFQVASSLSQELVDKARIISEAKWNDIYNLSPKGTSTNYFIIASGTNLAVIPGKEGVLGDNVSKGLVGYWKFDEATGTLVYDFSGNSQTAGMFSNASSTDLHTSVNCKLNSCGSFDGDIQRVKIATSTFFDIAAGNFSVCAWFRTADTTGYIVSYKDSINGGYDLKTLSGRFKGNVWYSGNSNQIDSGIVVTDNLWHYGCMVVNATTNSVYVDGLLKNSSNLSGVKTGAGSGTLYIGDNDELSGGSGFAGRIDKVRIYNRAISSDEIRQLYESANAPFTRFFTIENINRSGDDIVLTGGSDDPSTQKITSHVQWTAVDKTPEVKIATYLTRWRNFVFQQFDWVDGPGQDGPFTAPDNVFSTSTNTDYSNAPGSLKVQGF
ncbi:MAG: LamG domain-containing protein, partial [Candidatus Brennerbacteria bacterium]|nr:LamG domain-containing protein [Candidatus Brennerbacteria bacterium]